MSGHNPPHTPHANGADGRSRLGIRVKPLMDSSTFKEAGAFSVAELVSMGVSLGVVGVADQIAPDAIKTGSKYLAKHVVEPNLEAIEKLLSKICKLDECKLETGKSREERAEKLAHISIVFGAAWAISMTAKVLTRRLLTHDIPQHDRESPHYKPHPDDKVVIGNPKTGITKHEIKLFAADEGVHYGSLLLMNTCGAKVTDELIRTTTRILNKCGVSEKKAHELATMLWVWEFSNGLGAAAGIGVISKYNDHNWGQHSIR
jgi:hypothetical protein